MSTSADLPPLPSSPLEPGPVPSVFDTIKLETAAPAGELLEASIDTGSGGSLKSHAHTALVLVAFVACIVVRAFDPSAIDSDLLFLLGGGVLGTAGTGAVRR